MSNLHRHAPDQFDTPDEAAWFYTALDHHDDTLADQKVDAAYDTDMELGGDGEWVALMYAAWGRLAKELGETA